MKCINWGIIGCGNIAVSFAQDLVSMNDARLLAVASKAHERAEDLGNRYRVERKYTGYEKLATDPDIDVVYVATRHNDHLKAAELCLENNKPVLVEKPFCVNATEAEQLISTARRRQVFLMEAMWTRFLPVTRIIKERIDSGQIGNINMLFADFGFKAPYDPASRIFNPDLAGGALLDIGIYPISFASLIFGRQPDEISSHAIIGETGVDEQSSYLFHYNKKSLALLASTINGYSPQSAYIVGDTGSFNIHKFWKARSASLIKDGEVKEIIEPEFKGTGYNYQAREVMNCLRKNEKESKVMPLDESMEIMQTLDTIREQIGLRYPFEQDGF
jgi:predicted dehydrogenase